MAGAFDDAAAYDRFMGRFARPLADAFVAMLASRQELDAPVLDVGCGTGILTGRLADAVGPGGVSAVDPSPGFVRAAAAAHPGVRVAVAGAEALPFPDAAFGTTLAQLVVHFLPDPVGGLREMARVTRKGGVVAATVWDFAGGRGPLGVFERAARETADDPTRVPDEGRQPGAGAGQLEAYLAAAGLTRVRGGELTATVHCETFAEWWDPFTLGAGPAGVYVRSLAEPARQRMRERARELAGDGPITIDAVAWVAVGRTAGTRA